jgi:hypothetical protein
MPITLQVGICHHHEGIQSRSIFKPIHTDYFIY